MEDWKVARKNVEKLGKKLSDNNNPTICPPNQYPNMHSSISIPRPTYVDDAIIQYSFLLQGPKPRNKRQHSVGSTTILISIPGARIILNMEITLWDKMKNQQGHCCWVCWMSTGRKNNSMWRTHTGVQRYQETALPSLSRQQWSVCDFVFFYFYISKNSPEVTFWGKFLKKTRKST